MTSPAPSPRFAALACAIVLAAAHCPEALAGSCRAADGGAIGCDDAVTGSISPVGDTDSYTFEAAAGGRVVIRIVSHDFLNPLCFRLYDPSSNPMGSLQCGEAVYDVVAGVHTVVVESASGQGTGGYGLSIQGISTGLSCGQVQSCGQTLSASIDCKGDTDSFRFAADPGDVISIKVAPAPTYCYRLFGPAGDQVGPALCDLGQFTIPSGGEHTLLVGPNSPTSTGAYGVTRHGIVGSDTCAPAVSCGVTTAGQIAAVGDINAHTIDLAAPGGITVRIAPGSIIAPMCFRLFDTSGAAMGGRACDFDDHLVSAGKYTMLIEPSSSAGTGDYAFTYEGDSEDLQCGQTIGCGQTVQSSIEQLGDTDVYTFDGIAGETITIGANGSLVLQMCYRLYDPSGAPMGGRQCNSTKEWTLGTTGVHSIVVDPLNISGTGSFTLDVQCDACRDVDADGVCSQADNCPYVTNPGQTDTDSDGFGDSCDCAPTDGQSWGWPAEVSQVDLAPDGISLSWDSVQAGAGPGTVHDLLRGDLGVLPPGDTNAEVCLVPGTSGTTATDTDAPPAGSGFWYLVRGRNGCGAGPYGYQANGQPRTSPTCP